LTLLERRELLSHRLQDQQLSSEEAEAASVTERLWREVPALNDESTFHALLACYGLGLSEFQKLIGLSPARFVKLLAHPPEWLTATHPAPTPRSNGPVPDPRIQELLAPLWPIISEGEQRMQATLRAYRASPMLHHEAVFAEFRRAVYEALLEIVLKPMVVEMHIASRSGALKANDSGSRFEEFVGQFVHPRAQSCFLNRYPVVLRLAATQVTQTLATTVELLARVHKDRQILDEVFGEGATLGPLDGFQLGLGDPHCRGRTVAELRFAHGARIIYKPRDLTVDAQFQELLACVSRGLDQLSFRYPAILQRTSYGYMAFVEPTPCASPEELCRFYYRHGVQLALLYVLGGSDVHYENVIASGEYPVLVDLETMFTPDWRSIQLGAAEALADVYLRESVLGTGLLPDIVGLDLELAPVDVSGLIGGSKSEVAATRVPVWQQVRSRNDITYSFDRRMV